jgi:hypothetical protein
MSKILPYLALMVLIFVGLVGYEGESRAAGDTNPGRAAEMKQAFRDLWLGHIYWVQHAVLDSAATSLTHYALLR